MPEREDAFAIVRIDLPESAPTRLPEHVTVTEVVPTEEMAIHEVARLNGLNAGKGVFYFWQATRFRARRGPEVAPIVEPLSQRIPTPRTLDGIDVPSDFPTAAYFTIATFVRAIEQQTMLDNLATLQFWGAWSGIAYRATACYAHDEAFTASVRHLGVSPPSSERQSQEMNLFNFFANGWSTLECFGSATAALSSVAQRQRDVMADPSRAVRLPLSEIAKRFIKRWPDEPLSSRLRTLTSSHAYRDFRHARNVLTHRAHPGRTFSISDLHDSTALWTTLDVPIDEGTTRTRRQWLATELTALLEGLSTFAQHHLLRP